MILWPFNNEFKVKVQTIEVTSKARIKHFAVHLQREETHFSSMSQDTLFNNAG